jgi:2-oxoglutarate dehydrogenase E1 component
MHISEPDNCVFIRNEVELRQYQEMGKEERMKLLDRLLWADEFAKFIGTKFNTMKRFGLEGLESFIPGLKVMIQ